MLRIEVDTLILGLAQPQHGVVARWQLLAGGVARTLVDDRVKRGALEHVEWCVYRVPGLDGARRHLVAAVLAAGRDAAASYHTAAELHALGSFATSAGRNAPPIAVSTSRGHPDPRPGRIVHRVRLGADERTVFDGVPVTTLARTLLDVAAILPDRALEQALARAQRESASCCDDLSTLLARYPGRPGTPRLRALLAAETPPVLTRSEAEERFLSLVRMAQLPEPRVNAQIHGFEADFYWATARLVVEIDGVAYHRSPAAQQRDRHRDSSLGAVGIRVLRFTWADLTSRRDATLAKVAMALGHGRGG